MLRRAHHKSSVYGFHFGAHGAPYNFFAHVLAGRFAWAKKRAHPTVTIKEIAFYLRLSADKIVFLYAGVICR